MKKKEFAVNVLEIKNPEVKENKKNKSQKAANNSEIKFNKVDQKESSKKSKSKIEEIKQEKGLTLDLEGNYIIKIGKFDRELKFNYAPPKDSLSKFVFENDISKLEEKISIKVNSINVDFLNKDEINVEKSIENDLELCSLINKRDEIGFTASWTPLYWSVKLNRIECVKLLLNHGADVNMVINDFEECCGTVLDLATLRGDDEMESLLREHAKTEEANFGQSFKAIRSKLRGKAPAFNFRYYGKKKNPGDADYPNMSQHENMKI